MKKFKHILTWTIWGFIGFHFLLMTLAYVPFVQSWTGGQVSRLLSSKLHTEVTIGRIELGFVNRIIIDDIVLNDQKDEEMLRIGRLTAKIQLIPLISNGSISISSAQLFGAHFRLQRDSASATANYQFLIDALTSNDSTRQSKTDLHIGSFIMRRSSVSYTQHDAPLTPGVFNPHHLKLEDISSHILLKTLTEDSLNLQVKRLSFREQSGFRLQRIAFSLIAGRQGAMLDKAVVQLPRSTLYIDSIHASYQAASIDTTLTFHGGTTNSTLCPADLQSILPQLATFETPVSIACQFQGTAHSLNMSSLDMQTDDLQFMCTANGQITAKEQTAWQAQIQQLYLSAPLLSSIKTAFPDIPDQVSRLGSMRLSCKASKDTASLLNMDANLNAEAGAATLSVQANLERNTAKGHMKTKALNLGHLFGANQLGALSGQFTIAKNNATVGLEGIIDQLHFNNYDYSGIQLKGRYHQAGNLSGQLTVSDPNLNLALEGELRKARRNVVQLKGHVSDIAPQNLHLSDQWSDHRFSATLEANLIAADLNDAEGWVDVRSFTMTDPSEPQAVLFIDSIRAESGYEYNRHYLRMRSDFADMELVGQFDWQTLPRSFWEYVATKLPTLPGLPKYNSKRQTSNNFALTLCLNDVKPLRHLLNIPLHAAQPLLLNATIDDMTHDVNIEAELPSLTYNQTPYSQGHIRVTSPNDTVFCNLSAVRHMADGSPLHVSLNANAAYNVLSTTLSWTNAWDADYMSGQLNTRTQLYTNMEGMPEAHMHIGSSKILMGGAEWQLHPCDIVYNRNHLLVDYFNLSHGRQHLSIDGQASALPSDTLTIALKDIDVSYIQDLLNFHPVDFGGKATGNAWVHTTFDKPEAWANLKVSDFTFENGRMGTLGVQAKLNHDEQQIDLNAVADDGPQAKTLIDGFISPQRDEIGLNIQAQGSYIDFMQSFTEAFLCDVTGHAKGLVRLAGPLGAMNLTGRLVVDGQATVKALGTTYQLQGDTVSFVPDDILLNNAPLYDRYQNVAYMSGGIHHKNLTQLTFDLDITTPRLLAYDFPNLNGELFCGSVIVEGDADLHGRPQETVINCNATTLDGTSFTYNSANPDAISNQAFITFGQSTEALALSTDSSMRRLQPVVQQPPSPGSDLFLNLTINATPNATLRVLTDAKTGDYINLQGDGALRATYHNNGAFQLFGTYSVSSGTYDITIQNIIRKRFLFQPRGTIVFGGQPYAAALSLQAVYTVPSVSLSDLNIGSSFSNNNVRVDCMMDITGTPAKPQVDFDLDIPSVNADERQMIRSLLASQQETRQQVVYLLGIGRFYPASANNSSNSENQPDQTQLAMQSFLSGTISTQFNQLLSQLIKNDDWNIGANISSGNEGWKNAEYEGIISGKMLNNRLLLNGQFGYRDNATQQSPSFIGDFDLRYLLTPNGNLALKVYNQSNDRYFTNSTLNTQGIGLIMKKDFNSLKDFIFWKKSSK